HRFNRAQQDAFLPHLERGTVTLIGATTENPSFAVNAAVLSRAKVFRLHPLTDEDIERLLRRALSDPNKGVRANVVVAPEALQALAKAARGDARRALNQLEALVSVVTAEQGGAAPPEITLDTIAAYDQSPALLYDK